MRFTPERVTQFLPASLRASSKREDVDIYVHEGGRSVPRVVISDGQLHVELSIETIEKAALEVAKWKRQRRRLVHGGV